MAPAEVPYDEDNLHAVPTLSLDNSRLPEIPNGIHYIPNIISHEAETQLQSKARYHGAPDA